MKHDHFLSLSFYSFIAPVRSLKWIRKRRSETFFLCFLPLRCPQDLSPPFLPDNSISCASDSCCFFSWLFIFFYFSQCAQDATEIQVLMAPVVFFSSPPFSLFFFFYYSWKRGRKERGEKKEAEKPQKGLPYERSDSNSKKKKNFLHNNNPKCICAGMLCSAQRGCCWHSDPLRLVLKTMESKNIL